MMLPKEKNIRQALLFLLTGITALSINATGQEKPYANYSESGNLKGNFFETSVFVLSSFIPNDDTYFFELDYGFSLNKKNDVVFGLNIYQYTSPMSTPWSDNTLYPGQVISFGFVTGLKHFFGKRFFIDPIINPLILNYQNRVGQKEGVGFMLLTTFRTGYHRDFNIVKQQFYVEAGAEISYWPVNTNVPGSFKMIDDKYKRYVFSPALQFGFRF